MMNKKKEKEYIKRLDFNDTVKHYSFIKDRIYNEITKESIKK